MSLQSVMIEVQQEWSTGDDDHLSQTSAQAYWHTIAWVDSNFICGCFLCHLLALNPMTAMKKSRRVFPTAPFFIFTFCWQPLPN